MNEYFTQYEKELVRRGSRSAASAGVKSAERLAAARAEHARRHLRSGWPSRGQCPVLGGRAAARSRIRLAWWTFASRNSGPPRSFRRLLCPAPANGSSIPRTPPKSSGPVWKGVIITPKTGWRSDRSLRRQSGSPSGSWPPGRRPGHGPARGRGCGASARAPGGGLLQLRAERGEKEAAI